MNKRKNITCWYEKRKRCMSGLLAATGQAAAGRTSGGGLVRRMILPGRGVLFYQCRWTPPTRLCWRTGSRRFHPCLLSTVGNLCTRRILNGKTCIFVHFLPENKLPHGRWTLWTEILIFVAQKFLVTFIRPNLPNFFLFARTFPNCFLFVQAFFEPVELNMPNQIFGLFLVDFDTDVASGALKSIGTILCHSLGIRTSTSSLRPTKKISHCSFFDTSGNGVIFFAFKQLSKCVRSFPRLNRAFPGSWWWAKATAMAIALTPQSTPNWPRHCPYSSCSLASWGKRVRCPNVRTVWGRIASQVSNRTSPADPRVWSNASGRVNEWSEELALPRYWTGCLSRLPRAAIGNCIHPTEDLTS